MATLPEEKEMVSKYKSKPFAIIGIDSDGERSAVQKLMKQNKVTWTMVVDKSTEGPIATKWNVHGWPTMYVIDQQGVIRYKMLGDQDLPGKVAKVMKDIK